MLNGHDRFEERDASYFRLVQPYQHHTGSSKPNQDYLHLLICPQKPEEHQPSGTCNFSRIDNAKLNLKTEPTDNAGERSLKIFAVNYNVLRIMSGMGGLAYSN